MSGLFRCVITSIRARTLDLLSRNRQHPEGPLLNPVLSILKSPLGFKRIVNDANESEFVV